VARALLKREGFELFSMQFAGNSGARFSRMIALSFAAHREDIAPAEQVRRRTAQNADSKVNWVAIPRHSIVVRNSAGPPR